MRKCLEKVISINNYKWKKSFLSQLLLALSADINRNKQCQLTPAYIFMNVTIVRGDWGQKTATAASSAAMVL
jgi:hypothetical protein